MGKALLRNMAEAREKEEKKLSSEIQMISPPGDEQKKTLKVKKSVSFAQLPTDGTGEPKDRSFIRDKEAKLDWGDVAPARLRSDSKQKPMTKAQMNNLPMKLDVVERVPSAPSTSNDLVADSDDESVSGSSILDEGSADHKVDGVKVKDFAIRHAVPELDSGDDDEESDDEIPSDGDQEIDLDEALHRREIALTYLEKRNVVGSHAAAALTAHTHDGEDDWDQPVGNVPNLNIRIFTHTCYRKYR